MGSCNLRHSCNAASHYARNMLPHKVQLLALHIAPPFSAGQLVDIARDCNLNAPQRQLLRTLRPRASNRSLCSSAIHFCHYFYYRSVTSGRALSRHGCSRARIVSTIGSQNRIVYHGAVWLAKRALVFATNCKNFSREGSFLPPRSGVLFRALFHGEMR